MNPPRSPLPIPSPPPSLLSSPSPHPPLIPPYTHTHTHTHTHPTFQVASVFSNASQAPDPSVPAPGNWAFHGAWPALQSQDSNRVLHRDAVGTLCWPSLRIRVSLVGFGATSLVLSLGPDLASGSWVLHFRTAHLFSLVLQTKLKGLRCIHMYIHTYRCILSHTLYLYSFRV